MAKAIDVLFKKEQDVAVHLKQIGVLLLDISDSIKNKLSHKDIAEITGLMTNLSMNCDAITDDLKEAEFILKKVRAKQVTIRDTTRDTADLKNHLTEIKEAISRLRNNSQEFLSARGRQMVFDEMNKEYTNILHALTELMAESV